MDLKKDFPIFTSNPGLVYLDNASTTQKPQFVIDAVNDFVSEKYANIHRGNYDLSAAAEDVYMQSKKMVGKLLGCDLTEIIYAYNATACSNLIAQALCYSGKVGKGDTVILGLWDHHATIVVWQQLQKIFGFTIRYIPLLDSDYHIDWEGFAGMIDASVKVVACSHVSNVTGAICDMPKIRAMVGDAVFFIVDGSQSVPNFSVDVSALGCDCFFFTAHKMLAYTGLGVMYLAKKHIDTLDPLCVGGGVIDDVTVDGHTLVYGAARWEAGTPNIIAAVSLLAALRYIDWIGGYAALQAQEKQVIDLVWSTISTLSDGIRLIGPGKDEPRVGIFSFALREHAQDAADRLANEKICVRVGGHCAHPFLYHLKEQQLLRMSLYGYNTLDDLQHFFRILLAKKV